VSRILLTQNEFTDVNESDFSSKPLICNVKTTEVASF